VQRIKAGEAKAKDENRDVRDGDVVPACVQTCPTKAMYFGNIADPTSEVSKLSKSSRAAKLLEDLGTKPKVIYLNEGE
jgi:molybdopterin-containing oxidoreductase family iron-sulfur binding subunit